MECRAHTRLSVRSAHIIYMAHDTGGTKDAETY